MRSNEGSSLAEFGPALGILLLSVFFPLLDMIMVGFAYCQCMTLNSLQLQKAAELPVAAAQAPNGAVLQALPDAWQHTGLGAFVKLSEPPTTAIAYQDARGSDRYVIVSTTFSVSPFLNIPIIPGIPALSAPATFTISGKRVVEDPTS